MRDIRIVACAILSVLALCAGLLGGPLVAWSVWYIYETAAGAALAIAAGIVTAALFLWLYVAAFGWAVEP